MSSDGASRRKSEDAESRIPLPRPSPGVFRRSSSMRLRGEKLLPAARGSHFSAISESGPSEPWHSGSSSRQISRHRSLSLSGSAAGSYPHTPTPSPDEDDDADLDSLRSFGSACSAMSCDHAYFARNGTTFSGRRMKYVVHCSPHGGSTDEYLTPTQRANRQIRRLKTLLQQTQKDLDQKDQDIFRLTKEVVELRLFKASLDLVQDRTDCGSPTEVNPPTGDDGSEDKPHPEPESFKAEPPAGPALLEKMSSPSLADSGHFEDMAAPATPDPGHDKRLQELQRMHMQECQEMKEKHNDHVENLLQRLSDVNNRYCELRSDYDRAQDTIRQLERETESLRKSMEEHEERHKSMYLKMYTKGQEAARFEHADQVLEFAHQAPTRVSVPELLQQLKVTENELENIKAMYRRIVESRASKGELDPEITLQFLKSAIYYFLTDKENHQGHLNAIESILGYTENEKLNIEKAYRTYPKK